MKRLTSILAATLTLAACGQTVDPVQSYRDAMPAKESVQLGAPSADGTAAPIALVALSTPATLTADAAVVAAPPAYPDQSEFATVSYWSAVGINGGTWWTLTLVEIITGYPATDCDDHACTWGPFLGDDGLNNWKLEVTKDGEAYAWAFSGQDAIGQTGALPRPWVVLISGRAHKGVDRHHGHGSFTIFFDAQDSLAHMPGWPANKKDYGSVEITYDNTAGTTVVANAIGGHSAEPAHAGDIINASYSFSKSGPGGAIAIGVDNVTDDVFVKLDTRWSGTGAGRGDAIWSPAGASILTECWDGAVAGWAEVYDNYDNVKGTEDLCAFTVGDPAGIALPPR